MRKENLMMKKISDLRDEYNISQRELAASINVTQASISRWEADQKSITGKKFIKGMKILQYYN